MYFVFRSIFSGFFWSKLHVLMFDIVYSVETVLSFVNCNQCLEILSYRNNE